VIGICVEGTKPHHVTDEEQVDQRSCPDIATAHMRGLRATITAKPCWLVKARNRTKCIQKHFPPILPF
jgi:hypothetical protein